MRLSSNLFFPLTLAAALVASVSGATPIYSVIPTYDANAATVTALKIDSTAVVAPAGAAASLYGYIREGSGTENTATDVAGLVDGDYHLTFDDNSVVQLHISTAAGAGAAKTTVVSMPTPASGPAPTRISNVKIDLTGGNTLTTDATVPTHLRSVKLPSTMAADAIRALNSHGIYANTGSLTVAAEAATVAGAGVQPPVGTHQCFRKGHSQLCIKFTTALNFVISVRRYNPSFFETMLGKGIISLVVVGVSICGSAFVFSRLHYAVDPDGYAAGYITSSVFGTFKSFFMVTPEGLTEEQINIALHEDADSDSDYYPGQSDNGRRSKNRAGPAAETDEESAEPDAEEVDARAISVAAIALLLPFLL